LNKYAPGTDDGKEDGHHLLEVAEERAEEAERKAFLLEQQLAEKERKLENEKLLFNNSIDDRPIDDLVKDVCLNSNRIDRANEWTQKLKGQDIMTVGDLRECKFYYFIIIIFNFK